MTGSSPPLCRDEDVASFAQEQVDLLALKSKLPLNFYDIVRIGRSATTIRLGIAGRTGVVLGISTPQVFGVVVDELVSMVDLADLTPTGERVRPEDFRSGESIKVRPQWYASDQPRPAAATSLLVTGLGPVPGHWVRGHDGLPKRINAVRWG